MSSVASTSAAAASNAAAVAASTTGQTGQTSQTSAGSAGSMTQADFLQLLTAQLKYQTPTSPADPTQLASEFAAISTVNGISQLNSSVSAIQSGGAAAQIAQAAALVGKQVAAAGNTLSANANGTATGAFSLAGPAQDVQVRILNPGGGTAGTLDLGALSAGQQSFTWRGGTPGSAYTYQVGAVSAAGGAVGVTPYSVFDVAGVNVSGGAPTLNVTGSATPLPVTAVTTVLGASP
ncbi:MAG: flagellar hook capping protein [Rhodospirillales bacterium 20-64-7]|nr:MAG: flagellar hook capping protein [Rhodospirillales bacterium 20-64-7]